MFRIPMPGSSYLCRAAVVLDGSYVVVCGDEGRQAPGAGVGDLSQASTPLETPTAASEGHRAGGAGLGSVGGLGLGASPSSSGPFLAVYASNGALVRQAALAAPVHALIVERRVERWGGCLVTGDSKGLVTLYHPLTLQVGACPGVHVEVVCVELAPIHWQCVLGA
jgi:hypothetical protein